MTLDSDTNVAGRPSRRRRALGALITGCEDDERTYSRAALALTQTGHQARLTALAGRRAGFARALTAFAQQVGAGGGHGASIGVALRGAFRAAFSVAQGGPNVGDTIRACARQETAVSALYVRALRCAWSDDMRRVIGEQQVEVQADEAEMRALGGSY